MCLNGTLYLITQQISAETKKMMFLIKQWVKNKIVVYWIFTEAGHGTGHMDGVGACIKKPLRIQLLIIPMA